MALLGRRDPLDLLDKLETQVQLVIQGALDRQVLLVQKANREMLDQLAPLVQLELQGHKDLRAKQDLRGELVSKAYKDQRAPRVLLVRQDRQVKLVNLGLVVR